MKSINPYLTFNGNCREAMTFYQQCLGGELILQPIGESPLADKMPDQMKSRIMHAQLKKGDAVFMGSDMAPESGLVRGNSVSMVLHFSTEEETRMVFEKLSSNGGKILHPLEITFWGALFGDLTDKYGNIWMFNFDKNEQ